jgi:hypothetical protein
MFRLVLIIIGSGTRISNQIGVLIERTIGWIERDMRRKNPVAEAPPSLPLTPIPKQEPLPATQASYNGLASVTGEPPANGGHAYHDVHNGGPYLNLSYSEQPAGGSLAAPQPYQPTVFYPGSGHSAAADPQGVAPNPLIEFASQATQQVAQPAATPDIVWRQTAGQGNIWDQWTAAIADSQDRYSATALMNLGSGARDSSIVASESTVTAGSDVDNAGTSTSQWPLLLFDAPAPTNGP